MELNILDLLVIISLSQAFLFSIILLTQQKFRVKANKHLAYNLLLLVYIGISEFIKAKKLTGDNFLLSLITDLPWLILTYLPMIIYFLKSTNHPLSKSKKMFLLTIPFFFFSILVIIIYLHVIKLIKWQFIVDHYMTIFDISFYFSMLYNVIFCFLSYFIIKSSTITNNEKKWLKNIWQFTVGLIFMWITYDFVIRTFFPSYHNDNNISYPVWIAISIYVYWLIFKGLIQLKLSQDKSEINNLLKEEKTEIKVEPQVYEKSKNQPSKKKTNDNKSNSKEVYFDSFLKLMEIEKLYRNPDLSRDIIAKKLEISIGYLSQLISSSTESNFTVLINDYRVNDIKRMLLNPDFEKYSIVAIGLEAGFKSKSTFYTEFKKRTGYTPNQFKKTSIN